MAQKSVKSIVHELEATVKIGKQGLTSGIVEEIKKQLKKKKIVKVKFLGSFVSGKDKAGLFAELAMKTNSRILHKVGFTAVLAKNF